MKQGLTEIVFILDRSGSMSGLEKDTIGGFNSTIEKQKQEAGEAYVSTVLFDTEMEVLHDRTSTPATKTAPKRPSSSSPPTGMKTPATSTTPTGSKK